MKTFFKWTLCLVVLGVAAFYGHQGFESWQEHRDAEAIIGTPQAKLPEWATPLEYKLQLTIDPSQSEFSGAVEIHVELAQATDVVWLHGDDFSISRAAWRDENDVEHVGRYTEVGHSGVVKFELGQMVEPQTIALHIAFSRDFATDLAGLYKVERKDGAEIFTQFEATDARKAFPSFDEPRFKVPFTFQLLVPAHLQAVTNTPELQRTVNDGWATLDFAITKPLPTYLVAFAVGEFDIVDGGLIAANAYRDRPIPFRAIAIKGKGDKLGYAIKHTERMVLALEEYFGREYPYEKLDIIAVPDFSAGAMENAGLITYREQLLLIGDEPTISEQKSYYTVHAHELAHQWFGNLVTMPWWDDLWLNESFASWMEGKIVDQLRPDLRGLEGDLKSLQRVMDADSLVAARQIREPIKTNGDIDNAFDGITYTKGGGVLSMFENYIGEDLFRQGVQLHMQRFAWGNATAPDFIESMAQATEKPELVNAFLSFIEQPGVPLVNVDWHCKEGADAQAALVLDLAQSRYFPLGSTGDPQQTWNIPMCVSAVADDRENFCFILSEAKQQVQFDVGQCPTLVAINKDAAGYYRWTLTETQWEQQLAQLPKLNNLEHINLVSSLNASIQAGKSSPDRLIQSAAAFEQLASFESKFLPMGSLEMLAEKYASDQEKQAMNRYLKALYGPYLDQLGFDANTALDKSDPALASSTRRNLVDLFATTLKDPELRAALTTSAKQYAGYEADGQIQEDAMNPELVSVALSVAVQELGEPFYNHLEMLLSTTDDGKQRGRILTGMSATTVPALSDRVLGMVISTDTRMNEKGTMIFGQLRMPETQNNTYEWFKDKYGTLAMFLPDGFLAFAPMIGYDFCSTEQLADLQDFFKDEIKPGSGAERNMAKVTEMITNCATLKASIKSLNIPSEMVSRAGELEAAVAH